MAGDPEKEGKGPIHHKSRTAVALVFLMLGVVYVLTLDSTVIGVPFLLIGVSILATGWFPRARGPKE